MMPQGDYRTQDAKVTPPPRGRIDASMEALIHHFKLFTEGFRVPTGEVYTAVESPRGELGMYLVSDDSAKPFRLHVRGPSFVNLQAVPLLMRGGLMSDTDHGRLDGRPGDGRGGPVSPLRPEIRQRAEELVALYPHARSATLPLCHLAQEQDGYLTAEAMDEIAELTGTTPAEVRGTASFYDLFHLEPVGTYVVGVCTNIACLLAGGLELLAHASSAARRPGRLDDARTALFTLEEYECLGDCDVAPCVQVNSPVRAHDDARGARRARSPSFATEGAAR